MFQNFKNEIDFFIRSKTKFSRKNFIEKNPALIERNIFENNYVKDILDSYFLKIEKNNLRILDIGCKNWYYAKGEYEFFLQFSKDFILDGVEIDAYRLYSNFYSRYEVARYYIKDLKNTNYIVDNLLNIKNEYDYIIWFLPFVTIEPLKFWGLSKKYYCPEKLLNHAYSLLNGNGQMLIINQGEEEKEIQKRMLEKEGYYFEFLGEIKNQYFEYRNKRFGFLIQKY